MNHPDVDPRQLAALLDNRLDPRERARLLEQIGASDDATEILGDAAAVLREIDDDASPSTAGEGEAEAGEPRTSPATPPLRVLPSSRRWMVASLAAAAALAIAVAIPVMREMVANRQTAASYIALLDSASAGLPEGWNGAPWSATRSGSEPLTAESRAARVGARWADFELLARVSDARAAATGGELIAMLDEVPGAGAAVAMLQTVLTDLARGVPPAAESLAGARRSTFAVVGGETASLAMWVETARIAARNHDAGYFGRSESRDALARLRASPVVRTAAPGTTDRLAALLDHQRSPSWDALAAELEGLLRALGG